jgi:hypothetical protein
MNKIRFNHIRNQNSRLIATVATEQLAGENLRISCSICHENDMPTKLRGRTIAEGRLQKQSGTVEMSLEQFKKELLDNTLLYRFANEYVLGRLGI